MVIYNMVVVYYLCQSSLVLRVLMQFAKVKHMETVVLFLKV